jgi:transposase
MKKRYIVRLSQAERNHLEGLVYRGREAAYRRRHAQVLLLVDEGDYGPGQTDVKAAAQVGYSRRTVEQIRERCVTEGLSSALERKKRCREKSLKLDGDGEAQLVQLACSEAPSGHSRWTLQLLAEQLVVLNVVESISPETVRQVLKKHDQTVAKDHVVYSTEGKRGVCLPDGIGIGGLQEAL